MVEPSIVMFYRPIGIFTKLNRTVTCMVLKAKANDRRTSSQPIARMNFVGLDLTMSDRDIWILTESRAYVHPLSYWTTVRDMKSLNILDVVVRLSSRHSISFQWVPYCIGWNGNEIADS
ncbi:hypothetical protein TNCV_1488181 [Trichonephila clavipes]|nr:hypothetical protein TNCV_1488181 [Trichonephila clavipes]